MRRRSFIQMLLGLPGLALIRPPAKDEQQVEVVYTDSDRNTSQALAALANEKTRRGGVTYRG